MTQSNKVLPAGEAYNAPDPIALFEGGGALRGRKGVKEREKGEAKGGKEKEHPCSNPHPKIQNRA